jgi:hypothetical protein
MKNPSDPIENLTCDLVCTAVPQTTAPLRAVYIGVFTLITQDRNFVEIREVILFIRTYSVNLMADT